MLETVKYAYGKSSEFMPFLLVWPAKARETTEFYVWFTKDVFGYPEQNHCCTALICNNPLSSTHFADIDWQAHTHAQWDFRLRPSRRDSPVRRRSHPRNESWGWAANTQCSCLGLCQWTMERAYQSLPCWIWYWYVLSFLCLRKESVAYHRVVNLLLEKFAMIAYMYMFFR